MTGIMAAHSIPNLFYILRKDFSQEERRALLKDLCSIFRISDLNTKKIMAALDNDKFFDFEDCLQEQCAVEEVADYIVTRNPDDFIESRVKVIQPDELVRFSHNGTKYDERMESEILNLEYIYHTFVLPECSGNE